MVSNETNPLTSENYADLLIENVSTQKLQQRFSEYYIHPIHFMLSVVNVPVSYITNQTIQEFGYGVMPSLLGLVSQASIEASNIIRLRNIPNLNLRGQGVLLGIIDTGIDYTNPIFQNEDGTTRIVSIWDQTIAGGKQPEGFPYGAEYTREQINEALKSSNPLEVVPTRDENGHGTMVAGIAGGKEVPDSDFYGIATDAEYVIVKLKPAKKYLKDFFFVPADAICYAENDIAFALEYLLNVNSRLNRPMAVSIAVDTSQSSHDGRGTLSSQVSLSASTEGVAIILPGGNEGNARRHYSGKVDKAKGFDLVELNVGENIPGFSMELWGKHPSTFYIDITSPSGEYIPRIATGRDEYREITFVFESTIIHLDYQMMESQSGDQLILFRFEKPAPGVWKIKVYERGDLNQIFNIWLPMSGFIPEDTYFLRSDPYTTILTVANAMAPITVTAYNIEDDSLYSASSRGYSRLDVIKPDIAAPGVNIVGPTLDKKFSKFTGTSISAAHTAGIAAMLLEWGIVKGNLPSMNSIDMKKLLIRGARRNINIEYPNRDWGYGILDIYNVFDSLRSGLTV